MKKRIIFILLILALASVCFAAIPWRWQTGNSQPDLLNQFMLNPEFPGAMTIKGNVSLDDGLTDSPSLTFQDAGDATWIFLKSNGATGNLTATSSVGTSDLQIVTGNLKVGSGAEGTTLNGQDAYITGTLEVDGVVALDNATLSLRAISYTLPADNGDAGEQLQTDGAGVLTWEAAASGSPAGSSTQIQYNNSSAFGGISGFISDGTGVEVQDDIDFAYGADANWIANYDDSVDDQFLWITTNTAAIALTDPLWEILVPASPSAGQELFGIAKGSQSSNTSLFTVDAEGDVIVYNDLAVGGALTVTGTFTPTTLYQANIAAAASGGTHLTINAGLLGSGNITFGNSSTGKLYTDNLVDFAGNVDLGDTVASDTLSILAKIDTDVYIDDDSTHSPKLYFRDDGEDYWSIYKVDSATGDLAVTSNAAASDFSILVGNLSVGDGSGAGTAAMDGLDFFVAGDSEFDGAVQFDGAVTAASTLTVTGNTTLNNDVAINEQILVTMNNADEEVIVTNSAEYGADGAQFTISNTDNDVQALMYLLRLTHTDDGQSNARFIVLEDAAGSDKFLIGQGGGTAWTLTDNTALTVNAAAANTTITGIINVDLSTATDTASVIDVKVVATTTTGETVTSVKIDIDDDTAATGTLYALSVGASDTTPAGGSTLVDGIGILTGIDRGIVMTLDAASLLMSIDAATTTNTNATGTIDVAAKYSEADSSFIDIEIESTANGAGEEVHGILVEMDDGATAATAEIHGVHVMGDGTNGTGLQHGIVVTGANIDAGLQLETGYLCVGAVATAGESLGDDDGYVEGTLEVDGIVYADGGVELDNSLLQTATVEIINSELDALMGTPKVLVAGQGAGTLLEFVSAILIYDYLTSALGETSDDLAIEYDGGSAVAVSETIEMTGFIDASADAITRAIPIKDPIDAAADIVNKNLVLVNIGNADFTDGGTSASTMTVIITYRVHDVLGLP